MNGERRVFGISVTAMGVILILLGIRPFISNGPYFGWVLLLSDPQACYACLMQRTYEILIPFLITGHTLVIQGPAYFLLLSLNIR